MSRAKEFLEVEAESAALPKNGVILPSGDVDYPASARCLASKLDNTNIYSYFGVVVEAVPGANGEIQLVQMDTKGAATRFQNFVTFWAWRIVDSKSGKIGLQKSVKPPENDMREFLYGGVLADGLRKIELVSNCPLLVEDAGKQLKVLGAGYHDEHRVLVNADATTPESVEPNEAFAALLDVIADYDFPSDGDKLRMMADYLTPALVMGDVLGAQAPICITEADQSQSGKGYHQKCVRAFYRARTSHVTKRDGGTGSFDETLSAALVKGQTFISIDNFRGKLDSQMLESLLTAENDTVDVRVPYRGPVPVSARRRVIQLTSNGLGATQDLANRSNLVRIRKRPGHSYRKFAEGDLESHIIANQPYYLGCVFALIRAWHDAGRLRTGEKRHDRRVWAQSVEGILEHVGGCLLYGPLLDGIEEAKERLSTPGLSWLRSVCLAVCREPLLMIQELSPSAIADLCNSIEPAIEVPGATEDVAAKMAVGKVLHDLFRKTAGQPIVCDGFTVSRRSWEEYSPERRKTETKHLYRFSRLGAESLMQEEEVSIP